MGDETSYCVAGVGDIKIKMFDEVVRMLLGVRHVPGLRRNLILFGVLHDGGMVFHCGRDKKTMKNMEGEVTVMMGENMASHLHKFQGSTIAGGVMETVVARVAAGSHRGGGSRQARRVALRKIGRRQPKSIIHGSLMHG